MWKVESLNKGIANYNFFCFNVILKVFCLPNSFTTYKYGVWSYEICHGKTQKINQPKKK
jgi:hypothetical protein